MENVKDIKFWKELKEKVNASQCDAELYKCDSVAIIAGDSLVIEALVKAAELDCGIPMDWNYAGGRAIIRSKGDRKKCRNALYLKMPQSDLTQADM